MKKTLIILLCLILQLALVGCAGTKADTQTEQSSNETPAPAVTDVLEGNLGTGVSEVGGADTPDGTSVVVKPQCPPAYGVSFRLPSDWTYEVEQTDDEPTSTVRVVIRPVEPGMEGEISFIAAIECSAYAELDSSKRISSSTAMKPGRAFTMGVHYGISFV